MNTDTNNLSAQQLIDRLEKTREQLSPRHADKAKALAESLKVTTELAHAAENSNPDDLLHLIQEGGHAKRLGIKDGDTVATIRTKIKGALHDTLQATRNSEVLKVTEDIIQKPAREAAAAEREAAAEAWKSSNEPVKEVIYRSGGGYIEDYKPFRSVTDNGDKGFFAKHFGESLSKITNKHSDWLNNKSHTSRLVIANGEIMLGSMLVMQGLSTLLHAFNEKQMAPTDDKGDGTNFKIVAAPVTTKIRHATSGLLSASAGTGLTALGFSAFHRQ